MKLFLVLILVAVSTSSIFAEEKKSEFIRIDKLTNNRITIQHCIPSASKEGNPFCQYFEKTFEKEGKYMNNHYHDTMKVFALEKFLAAQENWYKDYSDRPSYFRTGVGVVAGLFITGAPFVGPVAGPYVIFASLGSLSEQKSHKRSLINAEEKLKKSKDLAALLKDNHSIIIKTDDLRNTKRNINDIIQNFIRPSVQFDDVY
jgi:hypothetical protein